MESEPAASETVTEPTEHIEPHVVSAGENQVEASMVEASEPTLHLADTVKLEQSLEQEGKERGATANETSTSPSHLEKQSDESIEVRPPELPDNTSSDGYEPSDASVVSMVRADEESQKTITERPEIVIENEEPPPIVQWEEELPVQAGLVKTQPLGPMPTGAEQVEDAPTVGTVHKTPATITIAFDDQQLNGPVHLICDKPLETIAENEVVVEATVERENEDFAVQKGLPLTLAGQVKVDQSELILPKTDEAEKRSTLVVTIDPVSGEEITVSVQKPPIDAQEPDVEKQQQDVETERTVRKSVSTSSLEKAADTKLKKPGRFHFSLHRGREGRKRVTRKGDSLDRTRDRSFGTSVKQMWENMSKTLKRKEKSPVPERAKPKPPRPPPVTHNPDGKLNHNVNEMDMQSLQSMSAVSLSNSPIVGRKNPLQEALPDFMEALPADSVDASSGYHPGEHPSTGMNAQQQRVLSWTASQIAGAPGVAADEATIQPTYRQHSIYTDDDGKLRIGSGHSPSAKPPRPSPRPTLHPLDYQPYHTEEGMSDSGIVQRRMNMMRSISSPGSEVNIQVKGSSPTVYRTPSGQVSSMNRPVVGTLDRPQKTESDYRAPTNVRRAQTLRTDYASRLRERVLSLRVEPGDDQSVGGTIRSRRGRTRKENYVCSDTIKFPKLSFRIGRKQKEKSPAVVHSEKTDLVIPRPQLTFPASSPDHSSVWVQQQITNNYEPQPVIKTESFLASRSPPTSGLQLTSLPLMAGQHYGYEKVRMISVDHSAREYDLSNSSYVSGELRSHLDQQAEMENLKEALRITQPFLVSWDALESENRPLDPSPELLANTLDCVRSFLNTCIRIRSADLQGHFAPIQYQLASFETRRWRNVARLTKWNNVLVVTSADGATEYLQLVPPLNPDRELYYAHRCVDIMLTNWLDRHHTNPQMLEGRHKQTSLITYQPISFISNLARVRDISPFSNSPVNQLFQLGVSLAVLLAYESHLSSSVSSNNSLRPVTNPEEIILGWSCCNCVTLFRLEERSEEPVTANTEEQLVKEDEVIKEHDGTGSDIDMKPAEPETKTEAEQTAAAAVVVDPLVKALCPDDLSVESAIDGLIDKIYGMATEQLNPTGIGSCLLKSVAPPDWVAMLVSRIAMHKS